MDSIEHREAFRKVVRAEAEKFFDWLWDQGVEAERVQGVEQALRVAGGELLRVALGAALTARADVRRCGRHRRCRCGATAGFKQHRDYRVETMLPGKDVAVRAAYYICRQCKRGAVPVLEELGVGADGMTRALRELVVLAGAVEPYESASTTLLGKMAAVQVSDVQVQRAVCAEDQQVTAFLGAAPSTPAAKVETVVVGIDGGMVHVDQRWQEAKLACLYEPQMRVPISAKRNALLRREVVAVLGDPAALRAKLMPRLEAIGATDALAVVLRDGAPWISNLAEEVFARRVEVLDWYHAVEHLHECARVLYGRNPDGTMTAKAADWSAAQARRLWDGHIDDVLAGLRFLTARQKTTAKRKAVGDLARFFTDNRRAMNYPHFRAQGWPCGSGHVESAVGHVIQQRMKRSGCRWARPGATAMLTLRGLYRSHGRWDQYWAEAA